MPWTPKQKRYLLSKGSPLTGDQKQKMLGELHADPSMGHAKKGGSQLKHHKATDGFKTTALPKGHKGHSGTGEMAHMPHNEFHPQNHERVGKHGKSKTGQHPHGGTMSGLHTFHSIQHKNHSSKMSEG